MILTLRLEMRKKLVFSIFIQLGLDANRKRSNFEKDMDNFLFDRPPVRKR